jgi:hypothetical protein
MNRSRVRVPVSAHQKALIINNLISAFSFLKR